MRFSRGRCAAAAVALVLLTLLVAAGSASAAEPPTLGSFAISPPSVNVSAGAQTVTVTAEIVSTPGATAATVAFQSPTGSQSTGNVAFTKVSGTANKGIWEASVSIKQYSAGGTWRASVGLSDAEGNHVQLSSTQLAGKGFPASVLVEGTEDNEAPQLAGLVISPSTVNVTSSSQSVNVTAHITDNLSGVAGATIVFQSTKQVTARASFSKVSGTETNGVWEATVSFAQFIQSGTWSVKSLNLADSVGNEATLTAGQLEAKGFPQSLTVESTEDTEAPGLASLTISPATVNTTSGSQTATATAEITDNLSGFAHGTISFESPSGKQTTGTASFSLVSGNATKGTYEAQVTFKPWVQNGSWKVANLKLVDAVGNEVNFSAAQLEAKAFAHAVSVESTEDTQPPGLAGLALAPTKIDTAGADQLVTVTAHATDNLSGVASGSIVFQNLAGKKQTGAALFTKVSGMETNGTYEAVVRFKQSSESGTWQVSSLNLEDNAGNEASFNAAQLAEKSFPNSVLNETGLPPFIRKLSPKKGPAAGGTSVTILGINFTGATVVKFGTANAAEVKINSPDSVTAVTPPGTTGAVPVSITTPIGTSVPTTRARFVYASPTVTGVSPNGGPRAGGTKVTITGTGFALGSETTFMFGKVPATSVSCSSTSSCTAVSPASAIARTLNVRAVVAKKKSPSNPADLFTYS